MRKLFKKSKVSIFEREKRPDDPRLKNIIKEWKDGPPVAVGIVGVPFDFGVRLSGGRVGAAIGPDRVRLELKKYGTAYNTERNIDLSSLSIADFGNVEVSPKNSDRTHENITKALDYMLGNVRTAIVIGGGNDISYASIRALSEMHSKKIGGMNIDAHFDVREVVGGRISSGTPYRKLLEEGYISGKNFFEVGVQGSVNSRTHYSFLKKRGVGIYFLSDIRKLRIKNIFNKFFRVTKSSSSLFVSIDIDSIAGAFAPGSSAPNPDGLFPEDILTAAYLAGKNPKVRLFEIMEVNPRYDIDNRTSRLAAQIIFEFLSGVSLRKKLS